MNRSIGNALLAGGIGLAFACAGGSASAQQKVFTISSTTFKDGQMFPVKLANSKANAPNNANCVGENVSPQLSWVNPPDGTKSFVLLMEDPEGRGGAGVHHMVTYGIAPTLTGFAEGELSKPSDKFVGGKATQGNGIYNGPCTPANVHHPWWHASPRSKTFSSKWPVIPISSPCSVTAQPRRGSSSSSPR